MLILAVYADEDEGMGATGISGSNANGKWLSVIKSADPAYVHPGDSVRFTIAVLNTSDNFAMENIVVEDEQTSDCRFGPFNLGEAKDRSYTCTQTNVTSAFVNEAIANGTNVTNGQSDTASDTAAVEILDLSADVIAQPGELMAPGGAVTFTATITNAGSTAVRMSTLVSPQLGDLFDSENPNVSSSECSQPGDPPTIAAGGTFACSFSAEVTGSAGVYPINLEAEGVVADNATVPVSASGGTSIAIFEVFTAKLIASRDPVPAGGRVTLDATITNVSATETIQITALDDTNFGDIQPYGNCLLPALIGPGASYQCQYRLRTSGAIGTDEMFVLNITAQSADFPPIMLSGQTAAEVSLIQPVLKLPLVAFIPRNDTCLNALPIEVNTLYHFYHDQPSAFYKFSLTETAEISVELSDFQSEDGQLAVYRSLADDCANVELIGHDGSENSERTIDLGPLNRGQYYIFVVNKGRLFENVQYALFVRAQ
ncbi:MAG: hypothetical protein ACK2UK_03530 [Candidatus Promineifilaceae bacterium]